MREYGLRPKPALWKRLPGVAPQATVRMAFGQTPEERNIKTYASGYDLFSDDP